MILRFCCAKKLGYKMHLNFSTNFPTKDRIFLKKPCALQLRNYSPFSTQLIRPNYSLLFALLQKMVSISPLWMVYLFKPLRYLLGGFLPSIWTLVIPFLVTSNILGLYLYAVRNFKEIDLFYSKFTARKDLVRKIVWTFVTNESHVYASFTYVKLFPCCIDKCISQISYLVLICDAKTWSHKKKERQWMCLCQPLDCLCALNREWTLH